MADKKKKKKQAVPLRTKPIKSDIVSKKSFQFPSWTIYVVIALAALIYIRAFNNFFTNFDDDTYLFYNPYIKNFNFDAVKSIFTSFYNYNYHPLTTLIYFFEYHLFGLNPLPFHVLNVLLHLLNILLVYKLVEKLSGKNFTALFVSVLFAIHPMHVESVAWVSELKDVLCTLFYLSALLLYFDFLKKGFKVKHYLLCLMLFILSLFSKSAAMTLPVLMIAIDIYKKRKPDAKMFLEKLPFFALSVLFGLLALHSQHAIMRDVSIYNFSFIDKIFLFTYTISFYLVKLVVPFHLSAWHYYPDVNGGPLPWLYYASLPFLILIGWLVIRGKSFRREKIFGVLFFLIVISVMLQIVGVGVAITAERYTYVAYIGLFYIGGQWISNIQKASFKNIALAVCGIVVILFSYLSWDRIGVWKDGNTLFSDVIKKYPDSYHAYCMRANEKCEFTKDYKSALDDYTRALTLNPNYYECLISRGALLINQFKDYATALQDWNRAIQLNSTSASSFNYRGIAHSGLNDLKEGIKDFNTALQMDSSNADYYNNRGMAHNRLNDTAAALKDFNKALKINPQMQKAYHNRGMLKANKGLLDEALTDLNKAISLDKDDEEMYRNRAAVKFIQKDFSGSIEDGSAALKINPKDSVALYNRGQARINIKDVDGACSDWKKALEYGYKDAEAPIKQFCK